MGKIIDTVTEWLEADDWDYQENEERSAVITGAKTDIAAYKMFFVAQERVQRLVLFVASDIRIQTKKRMQVIEYITRANHNMILGNLEIDMSDGELRFKIATGFKGGTLSTLMVQNMIRVAMKTMDQYVPGVEAICKGKKEVIEAIAEAEGVSELVDNIAEILLEKIADERSAPSAAGPEVSPREGKGCGGGGDEENGSSAFSENMSTVLRYLRQDKDIALKKPIADKFEFADEIEFQVKGCSHMFVFIGIDELILLVKAADFLDPGVSGVTEKTYRDLSEEFEEAGHALSLAVIAPDASGQLAIEGIPIHWLLSIHYEDDKHSRIQLQLSAELEGRKIGEKLVGRMVEVGRKTLDKQLPEVQSFLEMRRDDNDDDDDDDDDFGDPDEDEDIDDSEDEGDDDGPGLQQGDRQGAVAVKPASEKSEGHSEGIAIVIAAPSVSQAYYKDFFDQLIDFGNQVARAVSGGDQVRIIANKTTIGRIKNRVPASILVEGLISDIWIRDFAPVYTPAAGLVKFRYEPLYLKNSKGGDIWRYIENDFMKWFRQVGLDCHQCDLILDGGNFVFDRQNQAVITERVFEDNRNRDQKEIIELLKKTLGLEQLAILPVEKGDRTGHADGMVMWLSPEKLAVNAYKDKTFAAEVKKRLESALPKVELVEVPYDPKSTKWKGMESAAGIYTNSLDTGTTLLVPTYGINQDLEALEIFRRHAGKPVVSIDMAGIGRMGGSLHCLTWELPSKYGASLATKAPQD